MSSSLHAPFGGLPEPGAVRFRVWAPGHERVEAIVEVGESEAAHPLVAMADGYFEGRVEGIGPGARYRYRLDGGEALPDPASRSQPEDVHGPSEVVDPTAFEWTDGEWRGIPLETLVIYELHVGTFTPEGTFDAAAERLAYLVELGVTAIEVMPVAEFPGGRNWGYDGVFLFAPESTYGGPEGLRRLVDAAHARGLAVLLDVVYNHFGPEGNYLPAFTSGRIFTERHHTPWGAAVNYDGPDSRPVRELVIGNALHWAIEYHVDGLRLDATHAILDDSTPHLLTEMARRIRAALPADRHFLLIAEDERNERRVVTPEKEGGIGLDAVWADDLHHQLRRLTAGDDEGYFADYAGTPEAVARTLRRGWFYEGQHAPTHEAPRGTPAGEIAPPRFVHCIQNHDQVGNRAMGDRLTESVGLPVYRALSALLLLSPYTPLLWMGQEWAASSPFQYFTEHPEELGRLVTKGRREEFGKFSAFRDPELRERIPDPQSPETFERSRLDWSERARAPHAGVLALHRELLRIRGTEPAFRSRDRDAFGVRALEGGVALRREAVGGAWLLVAALGEEGLSAALDAAAETRPPEGSTWHLHLSTEEGRFGAEEAGTLVELDAGGALRLRGGGAVLLRARG